MQAQSNSLISSTLCIKWTVNSCQKFTGTDYGHPIMPWSQKNWWRSVSTWPNATSRHYGTPRHKSKKSEKLGRCDRHNMLRPYLKIWDWDLIFSRAVQWWLFPHLASVVRLHWHSKVTFGKTAGSVFLKHLRNFKSFKIQSTYFFYFDFYLKFLFLPSQFRWGWGWGDLICITQALNLICI